MRGSRITRARARGQSATPVLVFLGIVVMSVVFFLALTLPRARHTRREAAARAGAVPTETVPIPTESKRTTPSGEADGGAGASAPNAADRPAGVTPPSATARFASPRSFMETLAAHLRSGDLAAAEAALGGAALSAAQAGFFRAIFTTAGLQPASSAVREVGDVADMSRWSLRLEARTPAPGDAAAAPPLPEPPLPAAEPLELEVDLGRDAGRGWRAVAVHFPDPLRRTVAAASGAGTGLAAVEAGAAGADDPVHSARRFLQAALRQDFAAAREVTDPDLVTRKKVAGLCILFEEGAYALAEERPLSATAAGPDSAWVIVKVKSGHDGHESDFGLEMRRRAAGSWQVAGVNFSRLLTDYAARAGATDGVAYTPIVRNPAGGESLVVYFDFNDAGLVPRARRQLEIVANLLRDDPRRKLRLSGHADAIGSDTYNRRLSAARALVVKDTLAALGVEPAQIVTEGLGTLRPLDPNTKPDGSDNPEGRSRNRRTEIYLDF